MSKVRINELARQLEVPSHAIIDMLPELGVSEKKTHSSSVDEPVAEIIRQRVQRGGAVINAMRHAESSVAVAEEEPVERVSNHESPARHEPPPPAAPEHPVPVQAPRMSVPEPEPV